MGTNNRQRRAAKQRQRKSARQRTGDAGRPSYSPPGSGFFGGMSGEERRVLRMAALVDDAVACAANHPGDDDRLTALVEAAAREAALVGPAVLADHLGDELVADVHELWHFGWQPADLVTMARRHLGNDVVDLASLAVLDDLAPFVARGARMPVAWVRQVDELRDATADLTGQGCGSAADYLRGVAPSGPAAVVALTAAVSLLAFLRRAMPLPPISPDPCEWSTDAGPSAGASPRRGRQGTTGGEHLDPGVLKKVRALLAKAESTTFEEEAFAFTAKAQELMTRHAIDHALLDAQTGVAEEPEARRLYIDDPYASERSTLLARVADANRCQAVYVKKLGFSTIFGFGNDLDAVELLFTSLLVQASTAMIAHGPQRDRAGRSTTRSFRQSFWVGFSVRISERLHAASDAAFTEAAAEHGGSTALVPVLEARAEQVDETMQAMFPSVSFVRSRVNNGAGYAAGQAAADQARLGAEHSIGQQ